MLVIDVCLFFFFKQKTAYEMSISDWSSDVCSSDLNAKSGMLLPSDPYQAFSVDKSTTISTTPKWALELLSGDSTSFDAMANAINRMNQELARLLGVEHLLLGADGSGSLALARSKVGTF